MARNRTTTRHGRSGGAESRRYTTAAVALAVLTNAIPAAAQDFNGDGDPDVVIAVNAVPDRLWLSDGEGGFTFHDPDPEASRDSRGVAVGDLNGDGRLDAYFVGKGPDRMWLGDGAGGVAASDPEPQLRLFSYCVGLGDLDADGDLDAVICQINVPDRVMLNDGTGTFTGFDPEPEIARESRRLAIGDVNGDGNLDVVFATRQAPDRIWLGDGEGGFTGHDLEPELVRDGSGVALGDLDGDGDLDIVIANQDQPDRVHLNDGSGAFTGHDPDPDVLRRGKTVALGDVNNDGHLDVVVANATVNRLWLGDGSGNFTGSDPEPENSRIHHGVALADLDGDGNLDAVFAGTFGGRTRLWVGDGQGNFAASDPDVLGPDGGEEVAILPLLPQPVKRVQSFLAPVAVRAKAGKRLSVRTDIDVGPALLDLSDGATIRYGELTTEIPAFTPNSTGTRWTYRSEDKTIKASVRTARGGASSKAQLRFDVKAWDETLPLSAADDELLTLGFASGELDVAATAHLTRGRYRRNRGPLSDPPLTVTNLRATVRDDRPARVKLTAEIAGDGTVPGDPMIRIAIGAPLQTLRLEISSVNHDVRTTPRGYRFTSRRDDPAAPRTVLDVDFVKRRVRLTLSNAPLGTFHGDATAPFVFGFSAAPEPPLDAVEIQARRSSSRLRY